ncbi:hypothetical protein ACET3Z_028311 [Daucus carota]
MAPTVTKTGNSNGPLDNTKSTIDDGKKQGNGSTAWSKESDKQETGRSHLGIKETQLGNRSEQDFKKQQQLDRINRYWFLLDHDLVEAINKGNHALLHMAVSRVEFLIGVVSKELLEEGVKGEEEALWSIHEFLYNNGWWEKASNLEIDWNEEQGVEETMDPLLHFLRAYEHLIHPNSRVEALQGKREAVRMALNQIHYGSIELARLELKKGSPKHYASTEQSTKGKGEFDTRKTLLHHLQVAKNFIKAFQHLVEPSVLKDAMLGNDKAISLALGQIHHKTLPSKADGPTSQTYKEALLTPSKVATPKQIISPKTRVDRNTIKAEYMAQYGIDKGLEFGEFTGTVGNMDYYLARDMGMTMPLPNPEVLQNLGEGEVINGPPPPPPKKRKYDDLSFEVRPLQCFRDKGKEKVMEHYSFNDKGIFTEKAVKA